MQSKLSLPVLIYKNLVYHTKIFTSSFLVVIKKTWIRLRPNLNFNEKFLWVNKLA
jgi:hypothetical protein